MEVIHAKHVLNVKVISTNWFITRLSVNSDHQPLNHLSAQTLRYGLRSTSLHARLHVLRLNIEGPPLVFEFADLKPRFCHVQLFNGDTCRNEMAKLMRHTEKLAVRETEAVLRDV